MSPSGDSMKRRAARVAPPLPPLLVTADRPPLPRSSTPAELLPTIAVAACCWELPSKKARVRDEAGSKDARDVRGESMAEGAGTRTDGKGKGKGRPKGGAAPDPLVEAEGPPGSGKGKGKGKPAQGARS